jgi:hypothetical protein
VHENTLQGHKIQRTPWGFKEKLRRASAFRYIVITARSAEASEPSDGFRVLKAQEGQRFYTRDEAQSVRSSQRRRPKLKPLENWIFSKSGRKCRSSGGSTTAIGWADRFWTIKIFTSRKGAQKRAHRKKRSAP